MRIVMLRYIFILMAVILSIQVEASDDIATLNSFSDAQTTDLRRAENTPSIKAFKSFVSENLRREKTLTNSRLIEFQHLLDQMEGAEIVDTPFELSWGLAKLWTALHFASMYGHKKAVSMLLEKGSDVNLPTENDDKRTALHLASFYGHFDIVHELLKAQADIFAQDTNGQTPLTVASSFRYSLRHLRIKKLLRKERMKKTSQDDRSCVICYDENYKSIGGKNAMFCDNCKTSIYHKKCIDKWLSKDHNDCPSCRRVVNKPSDREPGSVTFN